VNPVVLVVGSFVLMEGVSYAAHRWVMHGFAMAWHRSHHAPPVSRFEKNDLFPVCFSAVGVLLFALGTLGWDSLWWVGVGVTAYGAAYSFVHEVYIHHRLPIRVPHLAYLEWLRDSHRVHHVTSAEPYGMLLPLLRAESRARQAARDPLERSRP
jgi:beta-carotene 3-hydroxylase